MQDIITRIAEYNKARRILFVGPIAILFLLFILLKFLLPDYFGKEKDLKADSGIIENILMDKYPTHERYVGTVYKNCLDIALIEKTYIIRLSDDLNKKYWTAINDKLNIHKRIEVEFQDHLLNNNILNNPNKISIDGKVIIPYGYEKPFVGWAIIGFSLITIVLIYFWYKYFKKCIEILNTNENNLEKTNWQLFLMLINGEI